MYELFSVVIHGGSTHGGHYHAYIRDVDGLGTWTKPVSIIPIWVVICCYPRRQHTWWTLPCLHQRCRWTRDLDKTRKYHPYMSCYLLLSTEAAHTTDITMLTSEQFPVGLVTWTGKLVQSFYVHMGAFLLTVGQSVISHPVRALDSWSQGCGSTSPDSSSLCWVPEQDS